MNDLSTEPELIRRRRKTSRSAVWSLSLVSFVWVAAVVLTIFAVIIKPADNDQLRWFIIGSAFLILLGLLIASIVLALKVLIKRERGKNLAIIALTLAALPFALFVLSLIRTVTTPSTF